MTNARRNESNRRGSVYLAVLGTALIVSLLAFSALALQRVQNRMLSASVDVRQAQLNAEAAIELGLLAIKNDPNWRTTYSNGTWFSSRSTGEGGCTLTVTDPIDANLADSATEAIVMTGVGSAGKAVQRVVRTIDSYSKPLDCLRSSVAAGGSLNVSGSGSVLRATNSGLISANSSSASGGATVYGKVEAVTVSGSTYSGTTSQIAAADRPAMPNWATVFDYYRTNGTALNVNSLPTATTNNFGRNASFDANDNYWTGDPSAGWTGDASLILPVATIERREDINGHEACLRVDRGDARAGAAQYIDAFLEPNQSYYIEINVYVPVAAYVGISLYTQSVGGTGTKTAGTYVFRTFANGWTPISATLTTPNWTGQLKTAFIVVNSDTTGGLPTRFYLDNLVIRENLTGRLIYQKVLSPNVNQLYSGAPTNSQGIYWINCNGNQLVIKRSRINGTLLVLNPGANSYIGGSVHWSPVASGYPALLVDADTAANADFTIAATNRSLSEAENGVNYHYSGAPGSEFNPADSTGVLTDTYPSEIQGLVVVEDDLTFQNNALVRGAVIAGDAVTATSGALEVVYRPDALFSPPPGFADTPSQAGRPLSIGKAVSP